MGKQLEKVYQLQAEIHGALSSPVRLRILDLLSAGEKTNTELLEELAIPKANLTQHLNVLKKVGLIRCRKEGPFQYSAVTHPELKDTCQAVRKILLTRLADEGRMTRTLKRELKGVSNV